MSKIPSRLSGIHGSKLVLQRYLSYLTSMLSFRGQPQSWALLSLLSRPSTRRLRLGLEQHVTGLDDSYPN